MKRVLLCAVLAGACSSRGTGGLLDFDAGTSVDGGGADRGGGGFDAPGVDVPQKGVDVPVGVDAGFPEDLPVGFDAGFPEDVPAPVDLGPACRSSSQCSAAGLVCDLSRGVCVECVGQEDCFGAGQSCVGNRCVAGFDAGTPTDRGFPVDFGFPVDRGFPVDTGTPTDRGAPRDAGPGATLLTGLGGPNGFGATCLPAGDDGSYTAGDAGATAISLGSGFNGGLLMRGQRYPSLYVNNNGNLSFGAALSTYSAASFPRMGTGIVPLIAPWWADVDTRGGGQPAMNQVCFATETARFVATWYQVGYYSEHIDLRNSFQVIVTPSGTAGDFDVEFRYSRCEWTTGDASGGDNGLGGTAAQAGLDLGDGLNYLRLTGSGTPEVLNLCGASNGSIPGVWRARVRSGVASFVAF